MKQPVIVKQNIISNSKLKTHMSPMVHMCFSNAAFSKRIMKLYLEPAAYDEFFANMIFLNVGHGKTTTESQLQTLIQTKWYARGMEKQQSFRRLRIGSENKNQSVGIRKIRTIRLRLFERVVNIRAAKRDICLRALDRCSKEYITSLDRCSVESHLHLVLLDRRGGKSGLHITEWNSRSKESRVHYRIFNKNRMEAQLIYTMPERHNMKKQRSMEMLKISGKEIGLLVDRWSLRSIRRLLSDCAINLCVVKRDARLRVLDRCSKEYIALLYRCSRNHITSLRHSIESGVHYRIFDRNRANIQLIYTMLERRSMEKQRSVKMLRISSWGKDLLVNVRNIRTIRQRLSECAVNICVIKRDIRLHALGCCIKEHIVILHSRIKEPIAILHSRSKESCLYITSLESRSKESSMHVALLESRSKESSMHIALLESRSKESGMHIASLESRNKESSRSTTSFESRSKESRMSITLFESRSKESSMSITSLYSCIKERRVNYKTFNRNRTEIQLAYTKSEQRNMRTQRSVKVLKRSSWEKDLLVNIQNIRNIRQWLVERVVNLCAAKRDIRLRALDRCIKEHVALLESRIKESRLHVALFESRSKESRMSITSLESHNKESSVSITSLYSRSKESRMSITSLYSRNKESSMSITSLYSCIKERRVNYKTFNRNRTEMQSAYTKSEQRNMRTQRSVKVLKRSSWEKDLLVNIRNIRNIRQRLVERVVNLCATKRDIRLRVLNRCIKEHVALLESRIKESCLHVALLESRIKESCLHITSLNSRSKESCMFITSLESCIKERRANHKIFNKNRTEMQSTYLMPQQHNPVKRLSAKIFHMCYKENHLVYVVLKPFGTNSFRQFKLQNHLAYVMLKLAARTRAENVAQKNRLTYVASERRNLKTQRVVERLNRHHQENESLVNLWKANKVQRQHIVFSNVISYFYTDIRNMRKMQKWLRTTAQENQTLKGFLVRSIVQSVFKGHVTSKNHLLYPAALRKASALRALERLFGIHSQCISSATLEFVKNEKESKSVTAEKYGQTWLEMLSGKTTDLHIWNNQDIRYKTVRLVQNNQSYAYPDNQKMRNNFTERNDFTTLYVKKISIKTDETAKSMSESRQIFFNLTQYSLLAEASLKNAFTKETLLQKQVMHTLINKSFANGHTWIRRFASKPENTKRVEFRDNRLKSDKQAQRTRSNQSVEQENTLHYLFRTNLLQKQTEKKLISKMREMIEDSEKLLQTDIEAEMQKYMQQEFRTLEEKIRIQEKLNEEIKFVKAELVKQTERKNDIERMRRLEEFFNNDMELDRKRYGIQ